MHWLHSVDQLIFHVGSTCHTTDEYYRVLCELLEDRQFAIVAAFSESKRSESGIVLAKESLADKQESKANLLRSEATILQNNSRTLLAQPALDACRLEVWTIQRLIELVQPLRVFDGLPDPIAHQRIQPIENVLDLAWKAYIEFLTYGAASLESTAQIMARGLPLSNNLFKNVDGSREGLYKSVISAMGWKTKPNTLSVPELARFAETVNIELETCAPMRRYIESFSSNYIEAMQNGISAIGGSSESHTLARK